MSVFAWKMSDARAFISASVIGLNATFCVRPASKSTSVYTIHCTSGLCRQESRNAGIQNGARPKNVTTTAMLGLIARRPIGFRVRPHRRLVGRHELQQTVDHFSGRPQAELVDVAFQVGGGVLRDRRPVRAVG